MNIDFEKFTNKDFFDASKKLIKIKNFFNFYYEKLIFLFYS